MPQRKPSGFVPSFNNFSTLNCPLLPCIPTTSLQLPSPKTISTMLRQNTLTFGITSFAGLSNKDQSGSFIALPMIWLPTHSPNLSLQLKSNFLLPNSDSHCLEGECWISKDKLRVPFHLFGLTGGRFHCMYYISLHSFFVFCL